MKFRCEISLNDPHRAGGLTANKPNTFHDIDITLIIHVFNYKRSVINRNTYLVV